MCHPNIFSDPHMATLMKNNLKVPLLVTASYVTSTQNKLRSRGAISELLCVDFTVSSCTTLHMDTLFDFLKKQVSLFRSCECNKTNPNVGGQKSSAIDKDRSKTGRIDWGKVDLKGDGGKKRMRGDADRKKHKR